MNSEPARQRVHAHALPAGCSHSVHFRLREWCSGASPRLCRCPNEWVIRLTDRRRDAARPLIPRGNKLLDAWSPVPVVPHCVHPTHKARTIANVDVDRGSGLVGICGVDLWVEQHFEAPVVLDAQVEPPRHVRRPRTLGRLASCRELLEKARNEPRTRGRIALSSVLIFLIQEAHSGRGAPQRQLGGRQLWVGRWCRAAA